MEKHSNEIPLDAFVFTIGAERKKESDRFLSNSMLAMQISGQLELETNNEKIIMKPGNFLLVRKHQFVKVTKIPTDKEEQKAILLTLNEDILRKYSLENRVETVVKYNGPSNILIAENSFLTGFFSSLVPYTHNLTHVNSQLSSTKVKEAIQLLLHIRPELSQFLFDFSEPHKIDLEKFMLSNFQFNVPIEHFAKLTGRSLSGFKRDFQKTFGVPPRQWLQRKRLEEAYYQIEKHNKKPSEIYLELGFESLPHFSDTFKKIFGIWILRFEWCQRLRSDGASDYGQMMPFLADGTNYMLRFVLCQRLRFE